MLRIPYVPTAYPDEMLASLLTRLQLYNGAGLWRSLLEETGYGRRTLSPFFSTPMQDAKLERLLAALGYTYPRMLRELTVLPFWLSFNQATKTRSQVRFDAASGRISRLTTLGHSQFLPGAQYCPACLWDDIKAFGEPYVHRNHQLPVARVCTRHGVTLRFTCPVCEIVVMPFTRALLRPPALRCQCGQDLSSITASPPAHQQALLRLSQFAADALTCTDAPWTLEQILAVLRERSGMMRKSFKRSAMQLMQDAYGPPDKGRSKASAVLSWEDAGASLRLKTGGGVTALRAPEFCALLAAAGLSFDEFRQAVSQVDVADVPVKPMRRRPFTIEQARQEFERFESESPGKAARQLLNSSPKLFWLLRLRDSAFVRAHGYPLHKPIPTVEADREKLEKLLGQSDHIPKNVSAAIRASIRDRSWLRASIQAQRVAPASPQKPAQRVQQDRAVALSRALFSVLRTQARPARVHAGLLAKFVQISMNQALHTIAHTPALQALVDAVNADKDRRLAFWAARSFIEEGRYPSALEVLVRAGLPPRRVNRQVCIEAIACFTASHKNQ